jgi:hypothetical protein
MKHRGLCGQSYPLTPAIGLEDSMKKFLFALVSLSIATAAFAANPDWSRTLSWPYLGNEFSTLPPSGGCTVEAGCFRVVNNTGYWISPGIAELANAQPGRAPVVDSQGVVMGVYVGQYSWTGQYFRDAEYGDLKVVDGDFRPAFANGEATYHTVNPGVKWVAADAIQFRPEALPMDMVYDLRFQRVVSYKPGKGSVVKHCKVYNDVNSRSSAPELAMFMPGDCH